MTDMLINLEKENKPAHLQMVGARTAVFARGDDFWFVWEHGYSGRPALGWI